jgi:drug/metabolite transporter (DMT)-like permease
MEQVGDLGEEGVVSAGDLTATLDDVPGHDRSGEGVPVVELPTVMPGGRTDDDGRVGHPTGDDNVGAPSESVGDTPAAEVGVCRDRTTVTKVRSGIEVTKVVAVLAKLIQARENVITANPSNPGSDADPFGHVAHGRRTCRGVESAGVGNDLDAPLQARAEDLLHLGDEGTGISTAPGSFGFGQDQHRQLGQPVAGKDIDGSTLNHLASRAESVPVEPAAVRNPQDIGTHLSISPQREAGRWCQAPVRSHHVSSATAAVHVSNPASNPIPERTRGIAGIAVAVVALSAGSTMVRSTGSPGPVVAFWRLLFGAILWHAIALATGRRFSVHALRKALPAGVFFGLNLTLFFTGITRTRIANAEFIGTLAPLIVVPFAAWRLGERLRPRLLVAAAAALSGVALILFLADRDRVGTHSWIGDLCCVGAVITWSCYLFATKSVRTELGVIPFMAGMSSVAAVVVAPFAVSTGKLTNVTTKGWLLIAVMCVTSGLLSHGLLTWSQRAVPISTLSLMQLAQPGFAVIWAWMFLHERVNAAQIFGMVVVLVAVGTIARLSATAGRSKAEAATL